MVKMRQAVAFARTLRFGEAGFTRIPTRPIGHAD